jgi:hypothetical protein
MWACQASKPSQRLRLYEYFVPTALMRAAANEVGRASEFDDMRVAAWVIERFAVCSRYWVAASGRKGMRVLKR